MFALVLVLSFSLVMAVPVMAVTDHAFNYTITATGTEDVTTYPDQNFNWTVTTTGTETWNTSGPLGSGYVSIYGYKIYRTYYSYPPSGSTITDWSHTVSYSNYGGRDDGTYIDTTNNRLVIKVYSGGYWSWSSNIPGTYVATYYIYGDTPQTATVTATESGSGTVNATEGVKTVGTFSLVLPPQHGGTVTLDSRTVTDDNPNVTTSIFIWMSGSVRASTDYSETVTQPWSDTETGSASVNATEGDKYITTSTLVAPNGDTSWSVSDDNEQYVHTWMVDSDLYASVIITPVDIDIKPGSFPNSINPKSKGLIPVAILGSATFDVTTVVASTVTFGPGAATMVHKNAHLEDVDGDGYIDLVLHFKTQDTGISAGDTEATLTGETVGGQVFAGTDSVNVVPADNPGKGKK